jgi:hypothetical protein
MDFFPNWLRTMMFGRCVGEANLRLQIGSLRARLTVRRAIAL